MGLVRDFEEPSEDTQITPVDLPLGSLLESPPTREPSDQEVLPSLIMSYRDFRSVDNSALCGLTGSEIKIRHDEIMSVYESQFEILAADMKSYTERSHPGSFSFIMRHFKKFMPEVMITRVYYMNKDGIEHEPEEAIDFLEAIRGDLGRRYGLTLGMKLSDRTIGQGIRTVNEIARRWVERINDLDSPQELISFNSCITKFIQFIRQAKIGIDEKIIEALLLAMISRNVLILPASSGNISYLNAAHDLVKGFEESNENARLLCGLFREKLNSMEGSGNGGEASSDLTLERLLFEITI